MATGSTTKYFLPYPLSTDPVRVAGDIEQLATKIDTILQEEIEDAAASMWTGGTFSNGLNTPTYNDTTGKMSMSLAQDLRTTASPQFVGLTLTGDAEIQGGDITTNQTTFNLINTTATTLNVGGAATTINIGNTSGQTNFSGDANVATGKVYKINNVSVLSATTLGSSVITSSLTSVGTITSGTWSSSFGAVSGANLTNLTAGNLTGTIPSTVLGNSTIYIGTTAIALNRGTASQSLTGITSIDGSAATLTTGRTIGMTGDVVWTSASFNGSGNVTGTSTISNSVVTYAKIQNVSAQYRILGRISALAGVVEELTPDNIVTLINQASTAIAASEGGTGQTSYAIGDILYASSSSALSKLAGVATGNALISGGVTTAPSWGKIGLTTHVSGTLPVANGGTGITSFGTGIATWLGTPSSANLAAAITDETGSGSLVFANSPTLTGTLTAGTINSTASTLTLLSSASGAPSSNASLAVTRGTSATVSIRWNETTDAWEYTNDGTTYNSIGSGTGGGSANIADILLFAGM